MKHLAVSLLLLFVVGCGSEKALRTEKIGDFISKPGEHTYSKHGGMVKIYEDGE